MIGPKGEKSSSARRFFTSCQSVPSPRSRHLPAKTIFYLLLFLGVLIVFVTVEPPAPIGLPVNWILAFDTAQSSVPALKFPKDGTTVTTHTPKFEWFEWSDASDSSGVTYDFVIVGMLDGQTWLHFLTKMGLTSPYYTPTSAEALSDGEYSWRVRAIDVDNESAWSVAWSLTVKTAVVPPPPSRPGAPVSEVDEVEPYWQASRPFAITATALSNGGSVESVELWYRWSYDNSTWIPWTPGGSDISSPWEWSFNAPAGDGFYEFYSMATDDNGNVEAARDMTDARCGVDTIAPPTPGLIAPSDRVIGDNTPSFDWSDENDPHGVTYELMIEIDGRPVLTKTGLTVSAYTLEADEALSVDGYDWRVRAVDGIGNASAWSETWSFVVVPTVAIDRIPAGETRLADFGRYNMFAVKVAITALRDISDAEVSIEEFIGRPAWLSEPPETAYPSFATIEITNVEPSDISSVAVQFQLSRAWVEQNEIDENTIELFKFDSEWRALLTALIEEDENHLQFEAVTSGFSVFAAVGGKRTPSPGIAPPPPRVFILRVAIARSGARWLRFGLQAIQVQSI